MRYLARAILNLQSRLDIRLALIFLFCLYYIYTVSLSLAASPNQSAPVVSANSRSNAHSLQSLPLPSSSDTNDVIPVLVFGYNRTTINRPIKQIIDMRPSEEQFPLVVSLDANVTDVITTVAGFPEVYKLLIQPNQTEPVLPRKRRKLAGYYRIARHYKWAISNVFGLFPKAKAVIIVEDDLELAPDFFEYFRALYPFLLSEVENLYCISAWNDNGKEGQIDSNATTLLYRTDFFPGLGWMLARDLWNELEPKWPSAYWDDWIRFPEQRKGRACIRPEISRTKTFGKKGVSNGQYYTKYLQFIKLNSVPVNFTQVDLSYLSRAAYDNHFFRTVYSLPEVSAEAVVESDVSSKNVRVEYKDNKMFFNVSKSLGIMTDIRSGMPRTAYYGVVSLMRNKHRIYLTPPLNWLGYNVSWK